MRKFTWVFIMFAVVFFYVLDGTGACHSITNVQLSPPSPATLPFDQRVEISFNYGTNQAGGVRIFARPFTNGSPTPNYAAHGSPIHPVGNGSVSTAYFTIKSGEVTVDQIRFRMLNANQSQVLLEFFMPVQYHYQVLSNSITNIQLTPSTPADLAFNERVEISFNYTTDQAAGVRIFARPYTNGSPTPNYAAHGSPLHPVGSGSVSTAYFTVSSGEATVDQIRFRMVNADQTQVLLEFFRAVQYHYSASGGGDGGGGGCFINSIQE